MKVHIETSDITGPEAERGAAAPASALPCLYNANCIEVAEPRKPSAAGLSPGRKRIRHKMMAAVDWMVKKHGVEKLGVLTLSFGVPGSGKGSQETKTLREQAKESKFVQNRWHSFCTNVVAKRYQDWVCVFELHRDRVWHLHVVVATKEDIRTGTNVEVLSNYKLPYWMRRGKHLRNEALAAEWAALRAVACRYRFGRIELLPVKKSAQAVAHYLADYLVKTYNHASSEQRCRLVRFSKGINQAITTKFTVNDLGRLLYRTRLKIAASLLGFQEYCDFAEYFGPRWNFLLKNVIAGIPMPFRFPKGAFESGFAGKVLADYALNPKLYLDERGQDQLSDASRELWRRLGEACEENSEARFKLMAQRLGDNVGDGPATPETAWGDLFDDPDFPF